MGPNTDPCGTPEVTWILSDVAPSSMTRCVQDVKNEFIQSSILVLYRLLAIMTITRTWYIIHM